MKLFTVDAFTNQPFKGNPAGVCVLDAALSEKTYLNIAQELNLSETAFVYPEHGKYRLRWFTPTNEVELCGHATLATAKILFDRYQIDGDLLEFETKSGLLIVEREGDNLVMNFPQGILEEVIEKDYILESFLKEEPQSIHIHNDWCVIELNHDDSVANLQPDFNLLLSHPKKIFIFTAKSSHSEYDFVSRVFVPDFGINEDPVTGSAHCYLATYWGNKLHKNRVLGYQKSKRGGVVDCELIENHRVLLRGHCVIMSEMLVQWIQ